MISSNTSITHQVLVERDLAVRTVILNRPAQLNALSPKMISRLLELFISYENDRSVKLIILKGNGRAFCAGGDVVDVIRSIRDGNLKLSMKSFSNQFTLNYLIATYSKPQISVLNGLVMGGGAGVSIHSRFRIATENSVFAMPETALGFFPDIGASYFLSRLPGFFGEYLGLVGARIDGTEMLTCGLATHFVHSERLSMLEVAVKNVDSSDPVAISCIISKFSDSPDPKKNSVCYNMDIIDRCFSRRTVEDILSALESEDKGKRNDWICTTIDSLKKASPTSLKVSLRSIREGRHEGIGKCIVREYRMVCNLMRKEMGKDFVEGSRAILLDKDRNPKWNPSKLELISDEMVDGYFSKAENEEWEDLKLPSRSNFIAHAFAKL